MQLTLDTQRIEQDVSLPKCIIVDIDGTVAHKGDRNPFDWFNVGLDTPDENTLRLIAELSYPYKIFFVSGRDEICRKQTEKWLELNYIIAFGGTYDKLYMRPQDNYDKDVSIKKAIYEAYFKDKYYVEYCFDDRDCVVAFWRELGFKVAQVNYGDF